MIVGEVREELYQAAQACGRMIRTNPRKLIHKMSKQACRVLALHARLKLPRHRWKLTEKVRQWAERFEPWKLAEHLLEAAMLPEGVQGTKTVYVSSAIGNNNGNDGSTWTLANATVAGGLSDANDATFNFVYVDSAHSYTATGAITWNGQASATTVIISVNRNSSTTTGHSGWSAGAAESIGNSSNSAFSIATSGIQTLYVFGLTIEGSSASSSPAQVLVGAANTRQQTSFETCTFKNQGTSANTSARFVFGPTLGQSPLRLSIRNCSFIAQNSTLGAVIGLYLVTGGIFGISVSYSGATKPTVLVSGIIAGDVTIGDSDLSGFNSGSYVDQSSIYGQLCIVNCKLHPTPALVTGTFPLNTGSITVINTDSGDTHNVFEYRNRLGTITENTTYYMNSGAQFDAAGVSWEIVTTSSCSESEPFICPWLSSWISSTGSQDLHLQLERGSATDYTDREVWAEFETLEDASFPKGTLTSTRNAQPFDGTGADLTNSSKTWAGSLTNGNPLECRVTRTLAEKSLARGRLFVGKASETLYLNPALLIGS